MKKYDPKELSKKEEKKKNQALRKAYLSGNKDEGQKEATHYWQGTLGDL